MLAVASFAHGIQLSIAWARTSSLDVAAAAPELETAPDLEAFEMRVLHAELHAMRMRKVCHDHRRQNRRDAAAREVPLFELPANASEEEWFLHRFDATHLDRGLYLQRCITKG
jgi:hypothetical protein